MTEYSDDDDVTNHEVGVDADPDNAHDECDGEEVVAPPPAALLLVHHP